MTHQHRAPASVPAEHEVVHRLPPSHGRFRRWFSGLHPSLRLVFLQLWMPVFMCLMFVLCYVGSFQQLAPRDVPVGIIASAEATEQLQQTADAAMPGAFDLERLTDRSAAQDEVRSGEIALVYDADADQIIVAGAHQAQAASLLPQLFTPLLGEDAAPEHVDIAPLPPGDMGMTPMYLMLAWCISGYLAAMFIGLMGGPLRRLVRFAVILGVGCGLSLLAAIMVDLVLGAVQGHFFALWGLGWAWAVSIGIAVNGLSYFCGRFIAAPAMTIFIFLSIPASGAAMPHWLMPQIFHHLNHVVVGSGISEMLKRLIYDVGPGYGRGWRMMLGYLVIGLLLTWIGKPFWERRRAARILSGRTTMFQDAQRDNGRMLDAEGREILAARGLQRRDDGALVLSDPFDGYATRPSGVMGPLEHEIGGATAEREQDAAAGEGAEGELTAAEAGESATDDAAGGTDAGSAGGGAGGGDGAGERRGRHRGPDSGR